MRRIAWVVVVAACAHNVPQDASTGADGRIKGARPIVFENDEAKVRGVVTYPGGDRVDWKLIQLPEGTRGTLDLSMTYTTPRPGLRLAFDVFDQWNSPVATAGKGAARSRSATVSHARGKYFVRIYAPRRGDAGAYKLLAAFHPDPVTTGPDPLGMVIPDPPRLPDAADTSLQCQPGTVPNPAGTSCVTPPPPPPPPPTPPAPPVGATPPAPPAQPVIARVLKVDVEEDYVLVTLGAGSESGIGKAWHARVLRGTTTSPMAGGQAVIIRVDRRTTVIKAKLTTNQIGANPTVELSP